MPIPIPGRQYTIQDENSLSQIAARAYGDFTLWPRIWEANQFKLKSGDPNVIFPGEVIIIPLLPEREIVKASTSDKNLSGKAKDEITIVIDGLEIIPTSTKIIRTMHTAADGWSATIPWQEGEDPELDKRVAPYAYPPAAVYIGGELIINGLLYTPQSSKSADGTVKHLQGFSFTADLIDSTMKPPYEKNNVTLKQRADELVKPFGIDAIFNDDFGGPFDRVTAKETDSVFSHLLLLAKQRSLLISSTEDGNLSFTKAAKGKPVTTLEEDKQGAQAFNATFDGRKRFNTYRALGQSPLGAKVGIAKDSKVPRSRFFTFQADETISGDIEQAAKWQRSKQLAEALTIPFPVTSWFDQEGRRWKENTLIEVVSPTLHLSKGFTFLIKSVEYNDSTTGKTATLNLIPPQVYTGEELVDPWS